MSYYGANPVKVFLQNTRDRLRGRSRIANARNGFLSPPQERGKVIWIRAGQGRESVLFAAELLAALRQKRLDVRLVLTYEEEYPDLLASRFSGLKKIGFGYGPADTRAAVRRVMQRFAPLGVVCVGELPGTNVLKALSDREGTHTAFVQIEDAAPMAAVAELCLPCANSSARDCREVLPVSDMWAILTPAQVEPSLGGVIRGGSDAPLWWMHGVEISTVCNLLDDKVASAFFAHGYLVVSTTADELGRIEAECEGRGLSCVRLSQWQRNSLRPGTMVLMDEDKWMPAIAASAQGIHLNAATRTVYWQAVASGVPVTAGPEQKIVERWYDRIKLEEMVAENVIERWQQFVNQPFYARQVADAIRAQFWQARRDCMASFETLLERIYHW